MNRWVDEETDAHLVFSKTEVIPGIKKEVASLFWCNSHRRRALDDSGCAPGQSGNLLPCLTVDLTGIAEIEEE